MSEPSDAVVIGLLEAAPDAMGYAGAEDIPAIAVPRALVPVADGDQVFGLRIVATPGHTKGHVAVLDEARELTLSVTGKETGGVLIGQLHRDPGLGVLFAEVTAQIPARHVEANATKLSFTAATWTEVQAALDLRTRGESMLGWWHSHPVREWCKDCPEEKRRQCSLGGEHGPGSLPPRPLHLVPAHEPVPDAHGLRRPRC